MHLKVHFEIFKYYVMYYFKIQFVFKGTMPRAVSLDTTKQMLGMVQYTDGIWVGLTTKNGK